MKLVRYFLICSLFLGCSCHRYVPDQAYIQKLKDNKTFWQWEKGLVHYEEKGDGENHVILLHGFGANTFTWTNQTDFLSQKGFHVWTIDFLGFGFSDKPLEVDYSVELYRQQILDFLDAKKIQKAHVIANSMGGTVALSLAEGSPEKISSLVLIDPLAYPIKMPFLYSLGKKFGKLLLPFFHRNLVYRTLKSIYYDSEKISDDLIEAYWLPLEMEGGKEASLNILRSFDNEILYDLRQSYSSIKMPILLLWGEQDRWIPPSHLAYFAEDFPHAKQVTIPLCGHAPQEEKPDEVNPLIAKFLHEI